MAEMAERLAPTEAGARGMVSALSAISAGMIILRRVFFSSRRNGGNGRKANAVGGGARGMVSALSAISAGMIILRRGFLVPAEMAEMAERLTP